MYVFTVFRLLTDFFCLYNYEFLLSLCKIVRSSVILLLPLFIKASVQIWDFMFYLCCRDIYYVIYYFLCIIDISSIIYQLRRCRDRK